MVTVHVLLRKLTELALLRCFEPVVSISMYAPPAMVPPVRFTVTGIEIPLPLSKGKLNVPVADTASCSEFPFKLTLLEPFNINWLTKRSPDNFKSALPDEVMRLIGTLLEISNTEPTGVEAFPNWKVPPIVFLVPPPEISPKSSSVAALLGFWKTIVPPENIKFPAEVTFKEPTLLS